MAFLSYFLRRLSLVIPTLVGVTIITFTLTYVLPGNPAVVKAGPLVSPEVVKELDAAYDKWWDSVQPGMVNEDAVGPKINPFKELYDKQFGGAK